MYNSLSFKSCKKIKELEISQTCLGSSTAVPNIAEKIYQKRTNSVE
jgi:hypothetical protein